MRVSTFLNGIEDPATKLAFRQLQDQLNANFEDVATVSLVEAVLPIDISDVTGLSTSLSARPTGSGTAGKSTRWTGTSALGDGAFTDDGTNATLGGNLTLSTFSAGSVLFAGTSGLVSQDNANLYWDDGNNRLGLGTNSPATTLHVQTATTSTGVKIRNTNASGNSSIDFFDDAGVNQMGIGYDNVPNRAQISMNNGADFTIVENVAGQRVKFFNGGKVNVGPTTTTFSEMFRVEGAVNLGTASSDRHVLTGGVQTYEAIGTTFGSIDSLNSIIINDSTAMATGVGGGVLFAGKYNGSGDYAGACGIKAMKANGSSGDLAFDLVFGTRPTGGSVTETFRLFGSGGANFVGDLSVATNKFTVAAASGNALVAGTLTQTAGDNYLNATSGSTGIGKAAGAGLGSKVEVHSSINTGHAIYSNRTPSGGVTSGLASVIANAAGTMDATAGNLTNSGVYATVTTTRSAGSNTLTNIAGRFDASGAQSNEAIRAENGDVRLNVTSGITTIGTTTSTDAVALTVNGRAVSLASAPSAYTSSTTHVSTTRTGTFDTTSGVLSSTGISASVTSTRSAGANALTNTAITATASGAQTNRAINATAGDVLLNSSSGTTTIGFSNGTASALTVSGQGALTSSNASNHALTSTYSPTAGTTTQLSAVRAVSNGTYDTTAGQLISYAVRAGNSSTRSAGANNLIVTGVDASASGTGPETRGLNAQSTGTGTNGYGVVASATGAATTNIGVDTSASGAGTTNLALRATSGDVQLNSTSGTTTIGPATSTAQTALTVRSQQAISASSAPSAATSALTADTVSMAGTFNTTGGALTAKAVSGTISSTRSAGASALTNIAGYFTASGGQTNIALQTDAGDVKLNQTSGTFSCAGAGTFTSTLDATGNFNVNTNKFSVVASSGNTTVAGTLDATGNFNVNTNKFSVVASSGNTTVAGTLDSTGNFNVATNKFSVTASNGNTLIAGALDHDGSTVGFYGTAPTSQQSVTALTDSTSGSADNTVGAIPDPADTPTDADALRDDLVANTLPAIRNDFADLTAKVNELRTVLHNLGLIT